MVSLVTAMTRHAEQRWLDRANLGEGEEFGDRLEILFDSGLRGGPDIACAIASGASFTFLGRSFMYGICAMGAKGGPQVMEMLERQLTQVLEQLGCARIADLPRHLAG